MYSAPRLYDNTEMMFGSSRDSTNYWSQYTHDSHVFTAWKMSSLLIRQLMDVLYNCSGCDGEKKNFSDLYGNKPWLSTLHLLLPSIFHICIFFQCFCSFLCDKFSNSFPFSSLSSTFIFFIYLQNLLAIMSPVILKTHTLIYLQFWLLVLVFSLSPSFCYYNY